VDQKKGLVSSVTTRRLMSSATKERWISD
jgi:hypothetical protein